MLFLVSSLKGSLPMEPYAVFPKRISHHAVAEQLAACDLIRDKQDYFTITPLGLFWAHNLGELFQREG
jgi:hypothetical protein